MSEEFKVEIVNPEKSFLSKEDVTEVVIPAFEGEMGILKDHISIISFLKPGIIKIFSKNKEEKFFEEEYNKNNVLLNAFNHCVTRHDINNYHFNYIYNLLKRKCSLNTCNIIKRRYRNRYNDNDEGKNNDNNYKYGNLMVLSNNNITLKRAQIITRNTTTNEGDEDNPKLVIQKFKQYKELRIKSNKNLFGNIYLNAKNELIMDDRSYLDSGSIYIGGNKIKIKNKCYIRAARKKVTICTQDKFKFDVNCGDYNFYPDPIVYNI